MQDGELASIIAQHSYNELVSLLVDRLGDEAALQTKPRSRPQTPLPAADSESLQDNLAAEMDSKAEPPKPSSASVAEQQETGSIRKPAHHSFASQTAELEATSHELQVRLPRKSRCDTASLLHLHVNASHCPI